MSKDKSKENMWEALRTTFSVGPNIVKTRRKRKFYTDQAFPRTPLKCTSNSTFLRSRSSQAELNKLIDDSDSDNGISKSSKLNIPTKSPVKSSRTTNPIEEDEDEEIIYDPDEEHTQYVCPDTSKRKPKSPIAFTSYSSKKVSLRHTTYSDEDIFLEASIDSQSPPIYVPETDSSSTSQSSTEDCGFQIDSDSSQQSVVEVPATPSITSISSTAPSNPIAPNEFYIDDDESTDSIPHRRSTIVSSDLDGECCSGIEPSLALGATIVESQSSSNSLPTPIHVAHPNAIRLRAKKQGLLEQLNNAINSAKSDFAFWHHERRAGLINDGKYFEVISVDRTFGRCLVYGRDVNEHSTPTVGLMLDTELKLCADIRPGTVLEVDLSAVGDEMQLSLVRADWQPIVVYPFVQLVRIERHSKL